MKKLFLFEIMMDTITFFNHPAPKRDDLVLYISLEDVFFLKSYYNLIKETDHQEKNVGYVIEYNMGKSYFFVHSARNFRDVMQKEPLIIGVYSKEDMVGLVRIPWHDAFVSLVDENVTYYNVSSPPISLQDVMDISRGTKRIGTMSIFIRLTCFGTSVSTLMQIVVPPNRQHARQFFFKSQNNDVIFQTQKYGLGSSFDALPVAPIFNSVGYSEEEDMFDGATADSKGSQFSYFKGGKNLFDNFDKFDLQHFTIKDLKKYLCKNPECPGQISFKEFGLNVLGIEEKKQRPRHINDNIPTDHGISHASGKLDCYGPENRYRRPKRLDQPFIPMNCKKLRGGNPLRLKGGGNNDKEVEENKCEENSNEENCPTNEPKEFTPAFVEDPAIACKELLSELEECLKAFKEALSPCGMLTCAYTPNLIQASCKMTCNTHNESKENRTKSKESLGFKIQVEELQENATDKVKNKCKKELHSTSEVENDKQGAQDEFESKNYLPFKVPLFGFLNEDNNYNNNNTVSACGIPGCPYARELCSNVDKDIKFVQTKPACGNANCPFTKKILGTANEDDMLLLQFLCTKPKTPCQKFKLSYQVPPEVPLPPIHWDCPEPLPEGNCRNPDCPFLPHVLRKFRPKSIIDEILATKPKEPCGNPCCPYCCYPPCPPCGNPACCYCVSPPLCPPPPSPPSPPMSYKLPSPSNKGKPCSCHKSKVSESPQHDTNPLPPCGNPSCPNQSATTKSNNVRCSNVECSKKLKKESTTLCLTPPSSIDGDERPCHLIDSTDSLPCRNPNCRFAKVDSVCINPLCAYNKTKETGHVWCGDTGCCLDNEYLTRSENDFCAKLICPKISFTGFLYK